MSNHGSMAAIALVAAIALGGAAAAEQPRVTNGRVTTQTAGRPLSPAFRALVEATTAATWIGYAVPAAGAGRMTCGADAGRSDGHWSQGCCGAGRLEPDSAKAGAPSAVAGGVVQLEAADQMFVLFRVEQGKVQRIRLFAAECSLDAGGRDLVWLDGVRPADSVALLESLAVADAGAAPRTMDDAITAMALHPDPAADAALERLVAPSSPDAVRRKVTFWLGHARGARGLAVLGRVLRDDPSHEVRKSAVFGVSQSREPGAVDLLSTLARTDRDPRIRSEALFWMAQQAGAKAAAAITDRIDNDPDTGAKKRAVFALSQLPKDEGVPLLVKVARTHRNPDVRKQAIFWLGQSNDPRALSFFEELLAVR